MPVSLTAGFFRREASRSSQKVFNFGKNTFPFPKFAPKTRFPLFLGSTGSVVNFPFFFFPEGVENCLFFSFPAQTRGRLV